MEKIKLLSMMLIASVFLMFSCKENSKSVETIETSGPTVILEGFSGEKEIDLDGSIIEWEGSKPLGKHNGTVAFSEGKLVFADGKLTGGTFIIDMNSIEVLDDAGGYKDDLLAHLKGTAEGKEDHFFDVAKYPTGKVTVNEVVGIEDDEEADLLVYTTLNLKEIDNEVVFKAKVDKSDNLLKFTTPTFKIDRTKWGIKYGSKSFFSDLGDSFIDDNIAIKLTVVTKI